MANQRSIDRALAKAVRGGDFSPRELFALQLRVQKFSAQIETMSRVVDRATGAIRQVMTTQV